MSFERRFRGGPPRSARRPASQKPSFSRDAFPLFEYSYSSALWVIDSVSAPFAASDGELAAVRRTARACREPEAGAG